MRLGDWLGRFEPQWLTDWRDSENARDEEERRLDVEEQDRAMERASLQFWSNR